MLLEGSSQLLEVSGSYHFGFEAYLVDEVTVMALVGVPWEVGRASHDVVVCASWCRPRLVHCCTGGALLARIRINCVLVRLHVTLVVLTKEGFTLNFVIELNVGLPKYLRLVINIALTHDIIHFLLKIHGFLAVIWGLYRARHLGASIVLLILFTLGLTGLWETWFWVSDFFDWNVCWFSCHIARWIWVVRGPALHLGPFL